MNLAAVREYIKTSNIADYYSVGKIDSKKDKSIGVYQLKRFNNFERAVGEIQNDHIKTKAVSILIHWNKNHTQTEAAAQSLYDFLYNTSPGSIIGGHTVCYIEMLNNEPIDVSCDDSGVYERVIEVVIHYEENEV